MDQVPQKKSRVGRPSKKRPRCQPVPNLTIRGGLSEFNCGMIAMAAHLGHCATEIAEMTYISHERVSYQLKKIANGDPYRDQSSPQPKETPESVLERRKLVEEYLKEDPTRNSNDIRARLLADHEIEVSYATVCRDKACIATSQT